VVAPVPQHEGTKCYAVVSGQCWLAVAAHYGVDPRTIEKRGGESLSRDVAAWLCRQLTSCTLRELAVVFGLGHADSVRNLTRRVDRALPDSRKLRQDFAAIRKELLSTEEFETH
jgi:chromosomal replication initiation ATPase DnaA